MIIIITAITLMIVQDVTDYDKLGKFPSTDKIRKEMTYVNLEDVVAIKTRNYITGGEMEFYMRNSISDSIGLKPITIRCYNDSDYVSLFRAI